LHAYPATTRRDAATGAGSADYAFCLHNNAGLNAVVPTRQMAYEFYLHCCSSR